jgi:RNA-directed DNA polymerase
MPRERRDLGQVICNGTNGTIKDDEVANAAMLQAVLLDGMFHRRPVPMKWEHLKAKPLWTERMMQALEIRAQEGWFSLKDKMCSDVALSRAWARVRANAGAPGVDGVTVERFERHLDERLSRLQNAMRDGSFQAQAIRRVEIPKADGSKRPLGIPSVVDRVAQAAVLETIEPILEHAFDDASYGFRPGRSCKDALRAVQAGLNEGLCHIVDADLQRYFDTIPHAKLMKQILYWIKDGGVLGLIEQFVKAEVISEMASWKPEQGTPQGAVLSPLLANLYLHPLDQLLRASGYRLVRYADDFVVMCSSPANAVQALELIQAWVTQAGLALHPEKTRLADLTQDGGHFDFLGYRFERYNGKLRRRIKPKKLSALKAKIKALTPRSSGKAMREIVDCLNSMLRGVSEYFKHVSSLSSTGRSELHWLDSRVRYRLRRLLGKRNRCLLSGRSFSAHKRWSNLYFHDLGLYSLHEARISGLQAHSGNT